MLVSALLVEDHADFANLVNFWLTQRRDSIHFDLRRVESLAQALSFLETEQVDLIITDLHLADSDGAETLNSLVDAAPDIPVVVLSGLDRDPVTCDIFSGAEDSVMKAECNGNALIAVCLNAMARHFDRRAYGQPDVLAVV